MGVMPKQKGDDNIRLNKSNRGNAKEKKRTLGSRLLNTMIMLLVIALGIATVVKTDVISLLTERFSAKTESFSMMSDIKGICSSADEFSANIVKSRDPVYVVDLDDYAAPKPDPGKFDENFEKYDDETISVHYYKERKYNSWFHFMEVRIKHPSQIRLALAYNRFASSKKNRKLPSEISADVNAVCAVNSGFYNTRWSGVLIHRRELLKNRPVGLDVLLIDANGNFHIVADREIESSGVLEEYDIINAVTFGPQLVKDGEALTITKRNWQPDTEEPRTAICQFEDGLHYLICLVEGRNRVSVGVSMQTFAREIAAKNVKIAYNLDGGQSGTMIIGNHLKNRVGWGPEKPQSDIIFFATAVEAQSGIDDQISE